MLNKLVDLLRPTPFPETGATEATTDLPTDTRAPARLGFWVLGVGFGGFLLWAALAPLNEGVPTHGLVTVDTKRKAVQHISGGIIKVVHVKEGQFVKEGDALLEIDEAVTQANYESVRQRYLTLRAMESRLLAEREGGAQITFAPELIASEDAQVKAALANEEKLFNARRGALRAEQTSLEEGIQGYEAAIRGNEGMLASRKQQQAYYQDELKGLRELAAEGYVPRKDLLAMERMAMENMGSISDLQGSMERLRRMVTETRSRKLQRQQEYNKEVEALLSEVRGQTQAEGEKYTAVRAELARTVIRAPADGQVIGFETQTVGGVISPGQRLMDIIPQNEALVLETRVPPHLIDRVHLGQKTDVRFSGFAHSPQLVVSGIVNTVSSDLLSDPHTGEKYYLARVSVTAEGMKILGQRQMQPGMPAEVIIITGERSLLVYLLRPLTKRLAVSMKEE